jgi:hypothetical protein
MRERKLFEPLEGGGKKNKGEEKEEDFYDKIFDNTARKLMEVLIFLRQCENGKKKKRIFKRLRRMIEKEERKLK